VDKTSWYAEGFFKKFIILKYSSSIKKKIMNKFLSSIKHAGAISKKEQRAMNGGAPGCAKFNCLDVYQPVICSNGVVYSNACYAARACQKNCQPYGEV
jgi:hypothetical protein